MNDSMRLGRMAALGMSGAVLCLAGSPHVGASTVEATGVADLVGMANEIVVLGADDRGRPVERARHELRGGLRAFAYDDGLALLVTEPGDTVVVVDLSAPLQPEPLAAYVPLLERDRVVDVDLDGQLGMVLTMRGRLELLDLAIPSLPGLLGSWETGWDSGISVASGKEGAVYLETADSSWYHYTGRHTLQVLDASDPRSPVPVATHDLGAEGADHGMRYELFRRNNMLLTSYRHSHDIGLAGWYLADALEPDLRWTAASGLYVTQLAMAATDSFAVMLEHDFWEDSTRVAAWHLSDGRSLPSAALGRSSFDGDMAAAGDHIVVLEEGESVAVERLWLPPTDRWVARLAGAGGGRSALHEASRTLYVHTQGTWRMVDLAEPSAPLDLGVFSPAGDTLGPPAMGGDLAASLVAGVVRLFDLGDPHNPMEVGRVELPAHAIALGVLEPGARGGEGHEGARLFLHAARAGSYGSAAWMASVEVTDPSSPVRLGETTFDCGQLRWLEDVVALGEVGVMVASNRSADAEGCLVSWWGGELGGVEVRDSRTWDGLHQRITTDGSFLLVPWASYTLSACDGGVEIYRVGDDGSLAREDGIVDCRDTKFVAAARRGDGPLYTAYRYSAFETHFKERSYQDGWSGRRLNVGSLMSLGRTSNDLWWRAPDFHALGDALVSTGIDDTLRVSAPRLPLPPKSLGRWSATH